jgi:restriction system protein
MENEQLRSLTPNLPEYRLAAHFLKTLDGAPIALYRRMYNEIWEQRGNPQENVDWTDPDKWIPERLHGEEQTLALRLWRESRGAVNPRHTRGCWYLCVKHDLLAQYEDGRLYVTANGRQFIEKPAGDVVSAIDAYEGILTILRLVAERGPGRRSEFLPDFTAFCHASTNYRSESPIKQALYDRLLNLIDRGYVLRSGQTYQVTDKGLAYLDQYASLIPGVDSRKLGKQSELRRLAKDIRAEAREQLAAFLADMSARKFESLIKFLLEEMGYTDVQTTPYTNDKGVDVVANIELGISSVREVVQAKRHKGNINRPVLDQLRGSLHRFNAVRGTLISTGGYSKGTIDAAFERGVAPITLIDGDKLIDLLIEHGIGVTKQTIEYFEFDQASLSQFEQSEQDVVANIDQV